MKDMACLFCGTTDDEPEAILIWGPRLGNGSNACICDACVAVCQSALDEHKKQSGAATNDPAQTQGDTPHEL